MNVTGYYCLDTLNEYKKLSAGFWQWTFLWYDMVFICVFIGLELFNGWIIICGDRIDIGEK